MAGIRRYLIDKLTLDYTKAFDWYQAVFIFILFLRYSNGNGWYLIEKLMLGLTKGYGW